MHAPKLLQPRIIVFAPPSSLHGLTFGLSIKGNMESGQLCLLYLSPKLEELSRSEAGSAVAHEFAHAALGHHPDKRHSPPQEDSAEYINHPSEVKADELIQQWGFSPAHRR